MKDARAQARPVLEDAGAGAGEATPRDFAALLSLHWAQAYRFAFRLAGRADEAEELVQQAAEEAFLAFGRFRPGTRFDRWFMRILYTTFLDRTRRERRKVFSLDDLPEGALPAGTQGDPEAALLQALDGPVRRALTALPAEYRAAVVLVDLEGLSYADAAAVLHCPVGTLRSRLHRGRLALREWLRPYVDALRLGEA